MATSRINKQKPGDREAHEKFIAQRDKRRGLISICHKNKDATRNR